MGRLCGVVLVMVAVSTAVLFTTAPVSLASGDTVEVFYQGVKDIQVSFPNGNEIPKGGELIIITSSQKYDMERSGIMFYACSPEGVPDRTTTITPTHYSVSEGNVVTHVFENVNTDIEMDFTDLMPLESLQVTENENIGITGDNGLTMIIMIISLILAAVMLTMMVNVLRMLEAVPKDTDGT